MQNQMHMFFLCPVDIFVFSDCFSVSQTVWEILTTEMSAVSCYNGIKWQLPYGVLMKT